MAKYTKKTKRTKKETVIKPTVVVTKRNIFKELVLPFFISFLAIFCFVYFGSKMAKIKKTQEQPVQKPQVAAGRLKEYLEIETELYQDPLDLIELIQKKNSDFILLDIRPNKDFQKEHILGAKNFDGKDFKSLKTYKNKLIILYGQTSYSKQTKTAALNLIKNGYNVKILSIGWNEFRHFKTLWVPEGNWDKLNPDNYVESNNN